MHVVLFDIDGTLLTTGGAGQRAMERALENVLGVTAPTDHIPAAGRTDWAITTDLFKFHNIERDDAIWNRFTDAYFSALPATLTELNGRVLPGVREILEDLHHRDNVCLGLLTGNFREGARLKLQHYGIDHYFRFGGYGDAHHSRDDVAHLAYRESHEHAGAKVATDRVWVIGDTPADVTCGRAIGANVVAVATGIFTYEQLEATRPDFLFRDLSDPSPFLARLT